MLTLRGLLDHGSLGKIPLNDLLHESLVQTSLSLYKLGPGTLYLDLEESSAFTTAQDIWVLTWNPIRNFLGFVRMHPRSYSKSP